MNNLREKIQHQLDRLVGMDPILNGADYDERYNEIVNVLEALAIGYSVDVTSDTLSDITAAPGELEGYELQDDDLLNEEKNNG